MDEQETAAGWKGSEPSSDLTAAVDSISKLVWVKIEQKDILVILLTLQRYSLESGG